MIPQRHKHVTGIARDDDIFDLRVINQAIQRQMRLDKAPVRLLLDFLQHFFNRVGTVIQPGRDIMHLADLQVAEDQMLDDHLHPGRA